MNGIEIIRCIEFDEALFRAKRSDQKCKTKLSDILKLRENNKIHLIHPILAKPACRTDEPLKSSILNKINKTKESKKVKESKESKKVKVSQVFVF